MKLFNLLFIVIILVTLQKSTAKEVAFPDKINGNGKILIDGQNKSTLKGCRYNDAGVVFCEVYFDYIVERRECNEALEDSYNYVFKEYCNYITNVYNKHYRIRIDLRMSGKCDLSKETKFKEVKLTYNYKGKDNYAQLIADRYDYISKGYLPDAFYTYRRLSYRFTFKTTKNCTFKGEFDEIKAYNKMYLNKIK